MLILWWQRGGTFISWLAWYLDAPYIYLIYLSAVLLTPAHNEQFTPTLTATILRKPLISENLKLFGTFQNRCFSFLLNHSSLFIFDFHGCLFFYYKILPVSLLAFSRFFIYLHFNYNSYNSTLFIIIKLMSCFIIFI